MLARDGKPQPLGEICLFGGQLLGSWSRSFYAVVEFDAARHTHL